MDRKTRLYLCSGCDIGECLDLEALASTIGEDYDLESCETHPFFCGQEGVEKIKNKGKLGMIGGIVFPPIPPGGTILPAFAVAGEPTNSFPLGGDQYGVKPLSLGV